MFIIIGADQKEYGPSTADEIREWIQAGRADGRTLAKLEGTSEWKPLAAFPEFAGAGVVGSAPPRISPNYSNDPNTPVLALEPNLNIGECLRRGVSLLGNNFGTLFTGTFLIWLIGLLRYAPPGVDFIYIIIEGVFYGGLYMLFLKCLRGQPARVTEIFSGFGVPFVQLLLTGFLTMFISGLGYFACVLPYIYLKIAWIFALPLVIDKRLEFWTAMQLSRRVVTRVWFKVFILTLVAFAPYILFETFLYLKLWLSLYVKFQAIIGPGVIDYTKFMAAMTDFQKVVEEASKTPAFLKLQGAAEIILLLNLPFATAVLMYAYEALFGPRPAPAA
ncbi:MAG TPA: DUF4339 domain-containing protein [Verrucomicrobiae bacterium]|jgi:hypothetical protein|nr:DUF4339 domain-containing protein [Verrucomicrobiae bacterium]